MRSKLFLLMLLAFSGCEMQMGDGTITVPGLNTIGKPLQSESAMSDTTGSDRTQIAMFDKSIRLIHEFDLTSMGVVRTFEVAQPEKEHSVLFDQATGMIADFSEAHVDLYDRAGNRTSDPVLMAGNPKSAAYDPVHGYLVVYDDMNSVGVLQIDANGSPIARFTGGPIMQNDLSLTAGDLLDDGSLVVGLNDGTLCRIDINATLAQQHWVFTHVATTLGSMNWIAPVHGFTDRVLTMSGSTVALVSLNDGSVISSKPLTGRLAFQSKIKDPHVIVDDGTHLTALYTDGSTVRAHSLNLVADMIQGSRLSVSEDTWSLVTSSSQTSWTYANGIETEPKDRVLRKYRMSDLAALKKKPLPDTAQIDVAGHYIFAMFPQAPLGYGQRLDVDDDSVSELRMYNARYHH